MEEDGTAVAEESGIRVILDYPGANATDVVVDGSTVSAAPDLRDAGEDWLFYWNLGVESDETRTVTVSFPEEVVGPWGPAVSQDRVEWSWLGTDATVDQTTFERTAFDYEFDPGERTFFAFSLPYVRQDFERFWDDVDGSTHVERATLTTTDRGSAVPVLRIGNPDADRHTVFACRHHACETPPSFILEGMLAELIEGPSSSWCAHVVPFVDLDGVQRGDQGKYRLPHDHNRDYARSNRVTDGIDSLYPTTAAVEEYVSDVDGSIPLALDLHSPYKWGEPHDKVFFAGTRAGANDRDQRLARMLDEETQRRTDSLSFRANDGFAKPGGRGGDATFTAFLDRQGATVSRTLEVPYFGTEDNRVTPVRCRELGRALARASAQLFED